MAGSAPNARLTLRGIEVFVAVIEEGSLAGGAKRLGASPSSVSQQIANLEAALGAELVDRGARPFALTPAGFMFQRRALAMLDEAAKARAELIQLDLATLPELRLAVIEDLDGEVTAELVARLAEQWRGCRFAVGSGLSLDNVTALESRAVDLVVAAEVDSSQDWLETHPILREPFVLVASSRLAAEGAPSLERLMAAPMIRYPTNQLMGRQVDAHLRRLRLSPNRRFVFEATASVIMAVRDLDGWALVTPLGLTGLRDTDGVTLTPPPFRGISRSLSLYARSGALGDLPGDAAELLRVALARIAVAPARARMPWLADQLAVLGADGEPKPPHEGAGRLRAVTP